MLTEGGDKPAYVGADVAEKASRAHARLRFRGVVQTVMLVNYANSTIVRQRSASIGSRTSTSVYDDPEVRVDFHVEESAARIRVSIEATPSLRLAVG